MLGGQVKQGCYQLINALRLQSVTVIAIILNAL